MQAESLGSRSTARPPRSPATATILLLAGLAVASTLLPAGRAYPAQIEGVRFADQIAARPEAEPEWVLRGLGLVRVRMLFRGYVAALYLAPGVSSPHALEDVPRRLEIEYFWGLDASQFATATNEGIRKNVSAAQWRTLEPRIQRFNTLYVDVEPGDRYALTYLPNRGTELTHNGRPLGTIPGTDFAAALFAIWLGSEPFDAALKRQLLDPNSVQ